jgi:hypothetical protein
LISLLSTNQVISCFKLVCCDRIDPPAGVALYPSMYIVGIPRFLDGPLAFEYAQKLIVQKNVNQNMSVVYQTRLMEVRQKMLERGSGPLGYSESEMGSFSDGYSIIKDDGTQKFMPQNYRLHDNKPTDDNIVTPPKEIDAKMTPDMQQKRISHLDAERKQQDALFTSTWEMERTAKLRQFEGGNFGTPALAINTLSNSLAASPQHIGNNGMGMQMSNQMPIQMSGQMPMQMPGQMPMQMSNQMPMQMSGQMPMQMSGQMPMQIPNMMGNMRYQ